jgi:hypothetical protein
LSYVPRHRKVSHHKTARRAATVLLSVTLAAPVAMAMPTAAYAVDPCLPTEFCSGADPTVRVMTGVAVAPETPDANLVEVPNASSVATKTQLTHEYNLQVAELLATNLLSTTPTAEASSADSGMESSAMVTPCVDACGGYSAPSYYKLGVVGHAQERAYWCVPASSQIVLSTMGASTPSQTTLANEMHTTSRGTYMGYAVRPLNRRQSRNPYILKTDTADASHLLSEAVVDTYRYKSSFIMAIDVATIGYFPAGWGGSHAIVDYGYYTQSGGGLYVFDPENQTYFGYNQSYYGRHTVGINKAWAAVKADGNQLVW